MGTFRDAHCRCSVYTKSPFLWVSILGEWFANYDDVSLLLDCSLGEQLLGGPVPVKINLEEANHCEGCFEPDADFLAAHTPELGL